MAGRQTLTYDVPIVDREGRPTPAFQRIFQGLTDTAASGGVAPGYYVRTGLKNGWVAATGTASRSTFATYAAPTAAGSYSQAQMQAVMDHIQVLSQHLKAVVDDLMGLEAFIP